MTDAGDGDDEHGGEHEKYDADESRWMKPTPHPVGSRAVDRLTVPVYQG